MKKIRCAIYTRKSAEEGLEQEFNSLDAQREVCAAYVASQKAESWVLLPTVYEDAGISGGTLERPGLQRLLADIDAAGHLHCLLSNPLLSTPAASGTRGVSTRASIHRSLLRSSGTRSRRSYRQGLPNQGNARRRAVQPVPHWQASWPKEGGIRSAGGRAP